MATVQAVIAVTPCEASGEGSSTREREGGDEAVGVSKSFLKWCMKQVPPESIVDVVGTVVVPKDTIRVTTQSSGLLLIWLQTLTNQAIFRVSSMTCLLFREFLIKEGFLEIHSPKIIPGSSEGGASVFTLDYFGSPACLAQSPQLYKQMVLSGDFDRVFEIGPVFRAENSNGYRHLCEFTGVDIEMTFKEHYFEVLSLLDRMFKFIFGGLSERCRLEIQTVHRQYPATPFRWIENTPCLNFIDGVRLLFERGVDKVPNPEDSEAIANFDISTEQERALGEIVREMHRTDFYMMTRYPLNVRPFYSMPCPDDSSFANSYDFFMRGNEIVSGAQRIHEAELLRERAEAKGIAVETIKHYIDAF
eukprot:Cvel_29834.t1-p1 / transcript=Cvel_29834.t1 / gene=Cvel_29834 / organism=Chromera_velia_CCMP2878 / gene_product=Aspartate--tRNA ligase, cytoplasmic, putative / transcript_product=Aspartate--tRNA ligase, cytoplasmic, putative / location=Cvel_scaffold4157:221-4419(+) / protein_length=360 / sequence_SO=supercontig / SO=protein_coding / is_pseudo=false